MALGAPDVTFLLVNGAELSYPVPSLRACSQVAASASV